MVAIRTYFEQLTPLSDQDWEIFSSKLVRETFPKKTQLLAVGQTENYLSFVASGIVRLYIPHSENDLTFGFVFENGFVSAYDSFLTQSSSVYAVECLTKTELWRISYRDLQTIYKESEAGNIIGRMASEELFLLKSKRELSLLNDSAEERYQKLFSERPELIRQVPLKYIASYIGVTPQALSRIRKRIS
ncbi:MAG: CarD family transcriptional regulator [Crocinitomicaceae bacterium]|nr:CarD family transcriptional regulator [Crocinitomicaceae bacterium]|tara:strand:- start:423 stop:989 length:567 start_codon:yes stop_codon:yes gene_type:complete